MGVALLGRVQFIRRSLGSIVRTTKCRAMSLGLSGQRLLSTGDDLVCLVLTPGPCRAHTAAPLVARYHPSEGQSTRARLVIAGMCAVFPA